MIECKIRRDKNCRIKTNGTLAEVTSEILFLIQTIHGNIKNENEKAADEFRRNLIASMIDPNSPIFK
jgi:hypothetical protein